MARSRAAAGLALALIASGCGSAAAPATTTPTAASPSPAAVASASPVASLDASLVPSPTAAAVATLTPTPTAAAATGAFTLTASVWFAGYQIGVTGGAYDAAKHTLVIDATFQNTSTQQTELVQLGPTVKVVWNSQYLQGYTSAGTVPVGATVNGHIQVQTPDDFSIADAVLTFGQLDEHQATVPLGGGAAVSDQPVALALAGKLKMGKYISYTLTSSMLVPGACTGYPDRIKFGPLKAGLISLVVWGTVVSTDPIVGGHLDSAYVVLADASKVISNPTMGLEVPYGARIPNVGMCFALPEPGSGTIALKMHEYRSRATGTLQLVIP